MMTSSSDLPRKYVRAHADRFRQELFEMLRIPSVSADPNYAADIRCMAEWLASHLQGLGLENVKVMETEVKQTLEEAGFAEVTLRRVGERMDCLVEARKPL